MVFIFIAKRRLNKMVKKKNVKFIRQERWRHLRLKDSWRKPRGKSSRMRRKIRGWPKKVSAGYGSARQLRGLHPSGLREVLVFNPTNIVDLDPSREVARVAATVGEKKKLDIMRKAEELNIKILNPLRLTEESEKQETEEMEKVNK